MCFRVLDSVVPVGRFGKILVILTRVYQRQLIIVCCL